MKNAIASLLVAATVCVAVFAAKPVADPLVVALFGTDVFSDTGDLYTHGVDGVHAILPATGNIVLDPDRNARGNQTPRSILLNIPGYSPPTLDAYFMSINSVGLACPGNPVDPMTPARDLATGECIQSELAVNQIAGTPWFLICGGEFVDDGLTNGANPFGARRALTGQAHHRHR